MYSRESPKTLTALTLPVPPPSSPTNSPPPTAPAMAVP